jgi:NitT/TauT family transport system substrate-binding protein
MGLNNSVNILKMHKVVQAFFAALICVFVCVLLAGCSSGGADSSSSTSGSGASQTVKVGTMPTEDFLPMWVAQEQGFFNDAGVDVELVSFDSAQALSAAITSGDVDMAMTDIMRAAKLTESGVSMTLEWITLGQSADQGVFGVVAPADAPYDTLAELADYINNNGGEGSTDGVELGCAVGSNTVPQYVFEQLCELQGVDASSIPEVEVASLPDRYALVSGGKITAAALPASMLELARAQGLKILASDDAPYGQDSAVNLDSSEANLSQSVMAARTSWANNNEEAISKVADAWDMAVALIDANPQDYLSVLVKNANLNDAVSNIYPVSDYPCAKIDGSPTAGLSYPQSWMVDNVLSWMKDKSYSSVDISYNASDGTLTKK